MLCFAVWFQLKQKCVYEVKTIAQIITQEAQTELERLRAIWVWLCHNIGGFGSSPDPPHPLHSQPLSRFCCSELS